MMFGGRRAVLGGWVWCRPGRSAAATAAVLGPLRSRQGHAASCLFTSPAVLFQRLPPAVRLPPP
jgi:hypothetical protein